MKSHYIIVACKIASLLSLSSPLIAIAETCPELAQLYQRAADQYQQVQQAYLAAGCQESGGEATQCEALEAATREMFSTVQMFAQRANALGCKPSDAGKGELSTCQRFVSLSDKAAAKLSSLQAQVRAQRCDDRPSAPACQALNQAIKPQRELIKATRRQALAAGCTLDGQPTQPETTPLKRLD